jgi:hypothetical protein
LRTKSQFHDGEESQTVSGGKSEKKGISLINKDSITLFVIVISPVFVLDAALAFTNQF